MRVIACLTEGLGMRATARACAVDANTVRPWLVAAAEQLRAFARSCLCEVHVQQLQLDELYAVLREVKAGDLSEAEAIKRLERSPYGVWPALAPESTLLVGVDVGPRSLEMAQRVVPQVVERLAPGWVPLLFTDGFREYMTAFLAHFSRWLPPERRQDKGPMPKPRWMPLPALLYAQVVKSYRHRRLVGGKHRVVCGTLARVKEVLAACGWRSTTARVDRLNRDSRPRVAAVGRRVQTLCQGEEGLPHRLVLFQTDHNFVLPHASLG